MAIATLLLLTGCSQNKPTDRQEPVKVGVVTVRNGSVESHRTYVGTVEEASSTPVSFGKGGRVKAVYVRDGQHVKAGDLLATVDNHSASSTCDVAKATLEQARDAYERAKKVHDKGSLPDLQWVEVQTRYSQALSTYEIAKRNLDDCSLYAPVSGTVEKCMIVEGAVLAPGMPAMNIVNLSSLYVRMNIPEVDVNNVQINSRVLVDIGALGDSAGMNVAGVVTEREVTADRVSHSYNFRVRLLKTPKGLLPGMVCSCRFAADDAVEGYELPNRAVQLANDGSRYVWTVKNGQTYRQPVAIGDLTRSGVLVTGGLQEGDSVVVDGFLKVSEGTEVKAIPTRLTDKLVARDVIVYALWDLRHSSDENKFIPQDNIPHCGNLGGVGNLRPGQDEQAGVS